MIKADFRPLDGQEGVSAPYIANALFAPGHAPAPAVAEANHLAMQMQADAGPVQEAAPVSYPSPAELERFSGIKLTGPVTTAQAIKASDDGAHLMAVGIYGGGSLMLVVVLYLASKLTTAACRAIYRGMERLAAL